MTLPKPDAKRIFLTAIECESPDALAHYLDDACRDDAELRARVELLIHAHQNVGQFLGGSGNTDLTQQPNASLHPVSTVIGPYKLLQQIGEGGMGTVYMAEQSEPIQRRVALKLIKPGLDSRQTAARFEAERQALALMDHQNIAKVLDAGATESGRPYFVMELVHGLPITTYCDQHRLSLQDRLKLFIPICHAVHHAHQKGVIHRDLKPSNVLVAMYDGQPVPKVIDFGVAKALGQKLTDKTMFTEFGSIVGTLEYMSPEQAEQSQIDIDTRSDIYSLGVILYELLTGTTPLDRKRLKEVALLELLRIIKEEEPQKPSTRLSSTDALPSIAANRSLDPKRLNGLVRGELDWIVMKSLEKDRNRRYEAANSLALDVQRYLDDEPVLACPPSAVYRLGKLVRRHKIALAAASVLGLALLGVIGSIGWAVRDRQALAEQSASQEATRQLVAKQLIEHALDLSFEYQRNKNWPQALAEARRAETALKTGVAIASLHEQVKERIRDLELLLRLEEIRLETTVPHNGGFNIAGADAAYADAFRKFGIDVETLPIEEAGARIKARSVAGELAAALDDWAAASRVARGADDLTYRQLLTVAQVADPHTDRDQMREIFGTVNRDGLVKLAASDTADWSPTDISLLGLQLRLLDEVSESVELLRKAQRRDPGDFYLNHELAHSLMALTPPRTEEALRFYTAALAIRPHSPGAYLNLGLAHYRLGALDEAVEALRTAIRLKPDYMPAHYNLAIFLDASRKHEEAFAAYREAIRLNPLEGSAHHNLGKLLETRGELEEAIVEFRTALRLGTGNLSSTHLCLGIVLTKVGKKDEAIAEYRTAIDLNPSLAEAHCNLGRLLQYEKKEYAEALALLRRGHELGSQNPAWKYPSDKWVANCQTYANLDTQLSAVLSGEAKAEGNEKLQLAEFCILAKGLHLEAARFYAEGFSDRPDLKEPGLYNAACAAAVVSTGPLSAARQLDEAEKARWRKQAIDWLRENLALYAGKLETADTAAAAELRKLLLHWKKDPDLAGLREPAAIAMLPESEREACLQLWADLERLLMLEGPPAPTADR
jgi:serine/threonine protein kinase/Tfp pilus assembly protein PilF